MGEGNRKLVAAGVVVVVVVVGYLVYDAFFDTEDRPPIVVSEGSFHIANTRSGNVRAQQWVRDGSRETWKMKHNRGKNATGYDVIATNTTSSTTCNPGTGTEVWIDYVSGASNNRFRFYLDPHPGGKKMEPAVDSPSPLAPGNSTQDRQVIVYPGDGQIVRIEVTGSSSTACTFQEADRVEVTLTIRY